MTLKIRKADINDAEYMFVLANDQETRNNSFSSEFIKWDEHVNWFKQKLNDRNSFIYIVTENNKKNIGSVKFDVKNEVVIGVIVDPNYRGLGFGSSIIEKGCKEFWTTKDDDVIAYIKLSNKASKKVFERAKFKLCQEVEIKNIRCYKLIAHKYEK